MRQNSENSNHALTMYRWTALASGLVCLFIAPLLRTYVPDLIDPVLLRMLLVGGYLGACALSFLSPWVKQNFQPILVCLTYAVSAWLIFLNHLNNFTPPLAYAVFEVVVGGSIAFVSLRSLSLYLTAVCSTVALLVQGEIHTDLHVEIYVSSLIVVAVLVLIVNYWRSQLLQEAQESSLLMQSVFSNSADGLVLLRGGKVVKTSANCLAMLNASSQADVADRLATYIADRGRYCDSSTDVHISHESGLNLWVEIVVTDVDDGDLQLMRLTDIEVRKQAELELTQAATTAESALRTRRDFLTTISHELRTPLNGVIGASRLLALEELKQADTDLVGIIERSGRSLLSSIDNIIAYAEMDSGDLALQAEPFSIPDCLMQAQNLVREQADRKQLTLVTDCAIGKMDTRIGDPVRLTQVLELLLSNAVKFTNQGSVEVRVDAEDANHPELLTFAVSDTGIGIEPELCEHIFDSFTQGDASDSREHGGIGLGLAISTRLVNRLGGRLGCRSKPGVGSTFHFALPLPSAPKDLAKLDSTEPGAIGQDPRQPEREVRLLLVEDNKMNQKITLRMLGKLGYQADIAEDGCEAVAACKAQHYDLILMDLQMPNMGGLEATAVLRSTFATEQTPIIALTANAQPSDRERCLAVGMNDFLAKPAKLAALEQSLQQHLETTA